MKLFDRPAFTGSFLDPRRNHDGRNPNPQPIKVEVIGCRALSAIGVRHIHKRGVDVVIEPTVLSISDHQQGVVLSVS